MKNDLPSNKSFITFAFLCLLLQSVIITSDILTFKVINLFGIILVIPAFLYPFTYIIGDILTEVFGRKTTLFVYLIAICFEIIVAVFISFSAHIHDPDNIYYLNFKYALGKMYIAAAGVVAGAVLGFLTNTMVMGTLKNKFSYRSFPVRSICSSVLGEMVFTIVAFMIWFHSENSVTAEDIFKLILSSITLKLFFNIIYAIPAYHIAKKLSAGINDYVVRIVEINSIGNLPGTSLFTFQLVGKRVTFHSTAKTLTLNVFSAMNRDDQMLIEEDLNGNHEKLNEWKKTHYE